MTRAPQSPPEDPTPPPRIHPSASQPDLSNSDLVALRLDAVIMAVTDAQPRVLVLDSVGAPPFLPSGPLRPAEDRTLELGVRRWVREQTGLELDYVEQLYTFGDQHRDPTEKRQGIRVTSVAYLALVREGVVTDSPARWANVYPLFPWEDWRQGRPPVLAEVIEPALNAWSDSNPDRSARALRRERAAVAFGLDGTPWDADRVLERYELLYEAELVTEALPQAPAGTGLPMPLDHRRIVATALGRLRGKIKYRPVVFELLEDSFTLLHLQQVVEALAGLALHKPNFRRLLDRTRLVEGTGRRSSQGRGRPAETFRFRREVLRERPRPGVGIPRSSA